MKALVLAFVLVCGLPAVSAQSLRVPTTVFALSSMADWSSTYVGLSNGTGEQNPLLWFTESRPLPTVLVGASMDVAAVWAWNRYVGRSHPKLARIGLYVAAGFRFWLTYRNVSSLQRYGR
jgi:hypothetical protein